MTEKKSKPKADVPSPATVKRIRERSQHEAVAAATASKGDVTRVEGWDNVSKCIDALSAIEASRGGPALGRPLRALKGARGALLRNKKSFQAAYAPGGSEAARLVYASTVTALWHGTALACAQCVEFREESLGYQAQVVPSGVARMSDSLVVERLEALAEAGGRHGFQDALERARIGEAAPVSEWVTLLGAAAGLIGALLYFSRDLVELYFNLRGKMAGWLRLQSEFLVMNAATLGTGIPKSRQTEYAARLAALSDRVRVESEDAQREAKRGIAEDDASVRRARALADPGLDLQLA